MSVVGSFIVPHPPLIIPEVGRGEEKGIQRTIDAYQDVASRVAALKPETIVLCTPHAAMYADYFHISPGESAKGDFSNFGAGGVSVAVEYDSAFVNLLAKIAQAEGIPAGTKGEREKKLDHGALVPLYFIRQTLPVFKLVRLSLSGLSPVEHYRFGKCVARAAENLDRRVVFIASGDLSHKLTKEGPYGYRPEGPAFDQQVTDAMAKGDFLQFLSFDESFLEAAAECGLHSFAVMAGALDGRAVVPELLSYDGPFGVGYGVAAFGIAGADEGRHFDNIAQGREEALAKNAKAEEDAHVALARKSLESYVRDRRRLSRPDGLEAEMLTRRAGVFVSLKIGGRLRGCIGTISPSTACIADEIIRMAVSAGTEDPRFSRVTEKELPQLTYSVDVLGEPESVSSTAELDAKNYGVIVKHQGRLGLLLPNIEGVDTVEEQLAIALEKGGISPREPYTIERFRVVRHR